MHRAYELTFTNLANFIVSNYFVILQLILGRMSSVGPNPDHIQLLDSYVSNNVSGQKYDDQSHS